MKYCKTCNMKYESSLKHCLFCNNPLAILPEQNQIYLTNYPDYTKSSHARRNFKRISCFLLILSNLLCLYIDFVTKEKHLTWSLYVCISTLYALLLILTFTNRSSFIKKLVEFVLVSDTFMLSLGAALGNYHWCTDLVIPITLMSANFLSLMTVLGKRERMFQYSVYPFFLSFLGLLYGLILTTDLPQTPWAIIVGIIYSGVTLAALFVFSPKASLEELLRRFHI